MAEQLENLIKRISIFVEDGNFNKADEYCEKVLDMDPENGAAYLYKLLCDCRVKKVSDLANHSVPLEKCANYERALMYADAALRTELTDYNKQIKIREQQEQEKAAVLKEQKSKERKSLFKKLGKAAIALVISVVTLTIALVITGIVLLYLPYGGVRNVTDVAICEEGYAYVKKNGDAFYSIKGYDSYRSDKQDEWQHVMHNIKQLSVSSSHIVVLKKDGTIEVKGSNKNEQYANECDFSNWTDIKKVYAGYMCTFGLKKDGTVVAQGDLEYMPNGYIYDGYGDLITKPEKLDFSDWTDIKDLVVGDEYVIGLKNDGTIIVEGYYTNEDDGDPAYDFSAWKDITDICAGHSDYRYYIFGLKKDGTVVTTENPYQYSSFDVSDWTDITDIAAGEDIIVGVSKNGDVLCSNSFPENDELKYWHGLDAIYSSGEYIIGIRADGFLISNDYDIPQSKSGYKIVLEFLGILS